MTCQCKCQSVSTVPAGYKEVKPGETLERVGTIVAIVATVVGILGMVFLGTAIRGTYYRRYWY